jgi:hypothetical protein
VTVGFRDRSLRHHADLSTAPDHYHALAVNALERRHDDNARDAVNGADISDKTLCIRRTGHLDLKLRPGLPLRATCDIGDVPTMAEDGFRDTVKDARFVVARNEQADDVHRFLSHPEKIAPAAHDGNV